MALLIVEHDGKVQAGVISGRVVIGRRADDQVCIRDKAVSPVHAWIGLAEDGTPFIADAGSRTGTFVNDQRIAARTPLRWGDRIRVGPVAMRLADGQTIPAGAQALDLSPRPSPPSSPANGISFDCACGAPLWAPWDYAGRSGQCRSCGAPITVPQPAVSASTCGVCHAAIQPREQTKRCPACGTVFHIECWTENGGCSAYGCSQVNAMQPPANPAMALVDAIASSDASAPQAAPWAYVLLAASVVGAVVGALTFGATALLAAAAAVVYLLRVRRQRGIVFLSLAVALVGAVAGVALSHYWWMGEKPWLPTR